MFENEFKLISNKSNTTKVLVIEKQKMLDTDKFNYSDHFHQKIWSSKISTIPVFCNTSLPREKQENLNVMCVETIHRHVMLVL